MPAPKNVPWDRQEHTAAKHDIYERYLRRWFPIILSDSAWSKATYAEGFAGPGVYTRDEEGSPIIAMRAFVEEVPNETKAAGFLFLDDDPRCVARLQAEVRKAFPQRPRHANFMPVRYKEGKCEKHLEHELDDMGAWGSPILAILDSWGNAPVSYRLLQRLAHNSGSELIITFEPQHFVRFVSQLGDEADAVFGGDKTWREAAGLPAHEKRRHILQCYRQALSCAGFAFLLDFELVDRRGNDLYIVFATNHRRGIEKMKTSLWEVDRAHGVGFRDPKDEQDQALFDVNELEPLDAQLAPLTRLLLDRLGRSDGLRVLELREYALFKTVFRPEHVIRALKPEVDAGRVELRDGGRNIRIGSIVQLAKSARNRGDGPAMREPRRVGSSSK